MTSCRTVLAFLLTIGVYFVEFASSLKMEEIIGGHAALQREFKYQAAIVGKYNYTYVNHLLCSAGIISDYLLISSARCFVSSLDNLKKLKFYAVIGVDVLINKDIKLQQISHIYTYFYTRYGVSHELAVTKLIDSLDLAHNSGYLVALEIPEEYEMFHGCEGIVAGFGIDAVDRIKKQKNREQIRINARNGLYLKTANVTILSSAGFRMYNSSGLDLLCGQTMKHFTELCGMMMADQLFRHRGVCMGDLGAPLVIDGKVVGIVSKHNRFCDDTLYGAIYTKVSKFKPFIDAIKQNRTVRGTFVYENPMHIPTSRSPLISVV